MISNLMLVCGIYLPLWKIWACQLGSWHSQSMDKTCSQPPTRMLLNHFMVQGLYSFVTTFLFAPRQITRFVCKIVRRLKKNEYPKYVLFLSILIMWICVNSIILYNCLYYFIFISLSLSYCILLVYWSFILFLSVISLESPIITFEDHSISSSLRRSRHSRIAARCWCLLNAALPETVAKNQSYGCVWECRISTLCISMYTCIYIYTYIYIIYN